MRGPRSICAAEVSTAGPQEETGDPPPSTRLCIAPRFCVRPRDSPVAPLHSHLKAGRAGKETRLHFFPHVWAFFYSDLMLVSVLP